MITAEKLLKRALPFVNEIRKENGRDHLELAGDLSDEIQEYFNKRKKKNGS